MPASPAAVRGIGLNLALRLYLLIIATGLPVCLACYGYHQRMIRVLHQHEIEEFIRAETLRFETLRLEPQTRVSDWLRSSPDLAGLSEPQRAHLEAELRRIVGESSRGIVGESIFAIDARGDLQCIAAHGGLAQVTPATEDLECAVRHQPQTLEFLENGRLHKAVSVPLIHAGAVRGVLHLELRPDRIGLGQQLPELRRSLVLGAAGLLAAIGLVVVLFFRFAVGRPIRRVISTMTQAAGGNLNALVDIHTGEFGLLAGSYNQMMRRLKSSVDENRGLLEQIKGFNEELRRKVDDATQELGAKNSQLQAVNERLFALQRRMTMLEKLATLGQLSTIIAHELGTPLNAISSHLQLLLEDPVSDPRLLARLKAIDSQVDRLTAIIRDVLKTMKVPPPQLDRVDLRAVVGEVFQLCSPIAQRQGVSLSLKSSETTPIAADAHQLQQVFMNLFTNAMDAMRGNGSIEVEMRHLPNEEVRKLSNGLHSALEPGPHVRVDVSDTGEGMDEEALKHIFKPFFSTKRPGGDRPSNVGTGLGLAIVRQIVKNHRGEILAQSRKGSGTTFTIYLPVEPSKGKVKR